MAINSFSNILQGLQKSCFIKMFLRNDYKVINLYANINEYHHGTNRLF